MKKCAKWLRLSSSFCIRKSNYFSPLALSFSFSVTYVNLRELSLSLSFSLSLSLSLHSGMSVKIFRVFKCRELDAGKFYLNADMSVRCFEGRWNSFMILAVVCAIVYVIGIPVMTAMVLRKNRAGLYDEEHPQHESLHRKYSTLYEQCECFFNV